MKEYQVDGYIITVGQSRTEGIQQRFLDNILHFANISDAANSNKAIYCYNLEAYKTFKGIITDIVKDVKIIGFIDEDLVVTFENLGICKELVCKISRSFDRYGIL